MVGNSDFMSLVIFLHVPIKKMLRVIVLNVPIEKNVEGNCSVF